MMVAICAPSSCAAQTDPRWTLRPDSVFEVPYPDLKQAAAFRHMQDDNVRFCKLEVFKLTGALFDLQKSSDAKDTANVSLQKLVSLLDDQNDELEVDLFEEQQVSDRLRPWATGAKVALVVIIIRGVLYIITPRQ